VTQAGSDSTEANEPLSADGRWKWTRHDWMPVESAQVVTSKRGLILCAAALGVPPLALILVPLSVGILALGDYPPPGATTLLIAIAAVACCVVYGGTGYLIGSLNRRWSTWGPAIAAWPVCAGLLVITVVPAANAPTPTNTWLEDLGILAVALGPLLSGGFAARHVGRPNDPPDGGADKEQLPSWERSYAASLEALEEEIAPARKP
jgi:hypothetical protein